MDRLIQAAVVLIAVASLWLGHGRPDSALAAAPRAAPPPPATRVIRVRVTAYCPCPICCGKYSDGITADGHSVLRNRSHFVATNTRLPFGTMLSVPGYNGGAPVPVWDRMAKSKEPRVDVFFRSHQRARQWGVQWLDVTVVSQP